jgi:beta-lactamase class A
MPDTSERLARAIEEIALEIGGVTAVAARSLESGMALDLRADERFPSASVIKVPILAALLAEVEAGRVSLGQTYRLDYADCVEGSGVLRALHEGLEVTVEDLAHLMIIVSDNSASNILIDLVGLDRIAGHMERWGFREIVLGRKFYDFAARDRGLDNWVSAGELTDMLTRIERRTLLGEPACEKILDIMRKQQFSDRIPKLLPPDTVVANKTGSIDGVYHDAAVIYAPAGPLVLTVLTREVPSRPVAEGGIRHIARVVYEHWGGPPALPQI